MDIDIEAIKKRPFLTVTEVGAMLGCSEKTVYRMVERGKLPPPKAVGGGEPRFPHRMIAAWLVWQEYAPECRIDVDAEEDETESRKKPK